LASVVCDFCGGALAEVSDRRGAAPLECGGCGRPYWVYVRAPIVVHGAAWSHHDTIARERVLTPKQVSQWRTGSQVRRHERG
jgi:hypothetical protein